LLVMAALLLTHYAAFGSSNTLTTVLGAIAFFTILRWISSAKSKTPTDSSKT